MSASAPTTCPPPLVCGCSHLAGNAFRGGIPSEWLQRGAFLRLTTLILEQNQLGGPLPAELAAEGTLPKLTTLILSGNPLQGPLPQAWAAPGALPVLEML